MLEYLQIQQHVSVFLDTNLYSCTERGDRLRYNKLIVLLDLHKDLLQYLPSLNHHLCFRF
jgi:hypothetical protein